MRRDGRPAQKPLRDARRDRSSKWCFLRDSGRGKGALRDDECDAFATFENKSPSHARTGAERTIAHRPGCFGGRQCCSWKRGNCPPEVPEPSLRIPETSPPNLPESGSNPAQNGPSARSRFRPSACSRSQPCPCPFRLAGLRANGKACPHDRRRRNSGQPQPPREPPRLRDSGRHAPRHFPEKRDADEGREISGSPRRCCPWSRRRRQSVPSLHGSAAARFRSRRRHIAHGCRRG